MFTDIFYKLNKRRNTVHKRDDPKGLNTIIKFNF